MNFLQNKLSYEKHNKYIEFFNNNNNDDYEYWGIGIENETYIMFDIMTHVNRQFLLENQKREKYSINYFINYKLDEFNNNIKKIKQNKNIEIPIYINSYLFQNMDLYGESKLIKEKINPNFSGTTIDQYIKQKNNKINNLFINNLIYDGDTFEFTTFNFYKSNVKTILTELKTIKNDFLIEINNVLVQKNLNKKYLFTHPIIYPPYNFGFVRFLSNYNNLGICNSGTYHINITLPTELNNNGNIFNPEHFKNIHANAIRLIQWFEPLLVALYGTPDIMHLLNKKYAGGSLRLILSRYIGIGTFDSNLMIKGKKLNDFEYNNTTHYFNKLHKNSPYIPPTTIGYDFNYNKFIKHGIELRIFDSFPEEYLEDVINFIVLLCQYSTICTIQHPQDHDEWNSFIIEVLQKGSNAIMSPQLYYLYLDLFNIKIKKKCFQINKTKKLINIIQEISNHLYTQYHNSSVCSKLSPNMKPIVFYDYNNNLKNNFKKILF